MLTAAAAWPEVDVGAAGDFYVGAGSFTFEGRAQYRLAGGNTHDISTRQSALFELISRGRFSFLAGTGFWLSSTENTAPYPAVYPPEPNSLLAWFVEVRPFVEARAPLAFERLTVTPIFRFQISAYHNFETGGKSYKYIEPAIAVSYDITRRWGIETRGRYCRGEGNDWLDVGFLEFGPRISW